MKIKLLVFPIDMSECEDYIRICNSLGISVYGASSEIFINNNLNLDGFVELPYVTMNDFNSSFTSAMNNYNFTHVYTPHQAVWWHLKNIKETLNLNFFLCGIDPFSAISKIYSSHDIWSKKLFEQKNLINLPIDSKFKPFLEQSSYSILHKIFVNTPGQTDEEKLATLCEIYRILPKGDILEIGSLYGRSAFALGFLADKHNIGNLICIDPWYNFEGQGESAEMLNSNQKIIDFDKVFEIFLSTVSLLNNVGYIRKASQDAISYYSAAVLKGELDSNELGKIKLANRISLLHIDGNHKYEHVKKDVEIWLKYLVPGGWLLLDDYLWAFGDGPKRLGDELLLSNEFDNSFVASDTLFLRRSNSKK